MTKSIKYTFIVCIVLIVLCFITFLNLINHTKTVVAQSYDYKPTIIIDPGHGGKDSGATNGDVLEKDINLAIALKLKDFFEINGFDVVLTRATDTEVDSKKRNDLQKRVDIFNLSPDNIVISIHQNKFSESQYSGTQIFYSSNNENSKALAESIQHSVVTLLQPDNNRMCKKAGSEIYILDNACVPAVLVECGFLSNQQEINKLIDDEYQNKIAYTVFLGFLEFYNTNY